MYKTFKEIKYGEFFYDCNGDLCVKVKTVNANEEFFWANEGFNAISFSEDNYYREWFEENSNEEFKIVTDNTEILGVMMGW